MTLALLTGVLLFLAVALHIERRRVERAGIIRSLEAGIDPATGMFEGAAASERMRVQFMAAERLGRQLQLARCHLDPIGADERAAAIAELAPPGSVIVRPTPTLISASSFDDLPEPPFAAADGWELRVASPADLQVRRDELLLWAGGAT